MRLFWSALVTLSYQPSDPPTANWSGSSCTAPPSPWFSSVWRSLCCWR